MCYYRGNIAVIIVMYIVSYFLANSPYTFRLPRYRLMIITDLLSRVILAIDWLNIERFELWMLQLMLLFLRFGLSLFNFRCVCFCWNLFAICCSLTFRFDSNESNGLRYHNKTGTFFSSARGVVAGLDVPVHSHLSWGTCGPVRRHYPWTSELDLVGHFPWRHTLALS